MFGTGSAAIYFLIFQFNTPIYVIGIFALAMGLLNGMAGLSINAYFAEEVPNEIRGRAYSATNAYIQIFSVSCLSISGITSEWIGIANTMTMASAIIIIGLVLLIIKTNSLLLFSLISNNLHKLMIKNKIFLIMIYCYHEI